MIKTCKNCGHEESEHGTQVEPSEPSLERLFIKPCYRCPCKKFEEDTFCGKCARMKCICKKPKKGYMNQCNCKKPELSKYRYCYKCQKPKNHSPECKDGGNCVCKEHKLDPIIINSPKNLKSLKTSKGKPEANSKMPIEVETSGTSNHSPHVVEKETSRISSSQPSGHEGTFNLSEKMHIGTIAECGSDCSQHVKEFISNEEFLLIQLETKEITWKEFWEKRNKLAGEELSR